MKTWQLLKKNPYLFSRYFVKEHVIKASRRFFEDRGYHELESPILASALPSERYIEPLTTTLTAAHQKNKTVYLIPSAETYNKKILVAGLGSHFSISKTFRGLEDIGPNHSSEFTMLEWYSIDQDYTDIMNDCERLIVNIKKYIDNKNNQPLSPILSYNGKTIDLTAPWPRISVREALMKSSNISLEEIQSLEQIQEVARNRCYEVSDTDDWETLFELVFLPEIEANLPEDRPCFLYDYPAIMCPLTKTKDSDPLVCEKVELYIAGKEIANGYTELLDWQEQEKRFKEEATARKKLGKEPIAYDIELIEALKLGIPSVAGMGLGIDRLAMIFADARNISDVNYFPTAELFDDIAE